MRTITFTQMSIAKRKNIFILLILFPLFFSVNAQTPKEIITSIHDHIASGRYKEALLFESQHSTANYRNYDFEKGAKKLKDKINGMGGIKDFKILDDFESVYNVDIKARVFYGDGGVIESIYHFRKEKKKWKFMYGRTKVRVIEKGTSEAIDTKKTEPAAAEPAKEYSSVKERITDVLNEHGSRTLSFLMPAAFVLGLHYVSGDNVLLGLLIWVVLIAIPVAAYFLLPVFKRIDAKHRIVEEKKVLYIPIISAALGASSMLLGNISVLIMLIALLVGTYFIFEYWAPTKRRVYRIVNLCLFSFYCYFAGAIAINIVIAVLVVFFVLKGLASPSSSRGGSGAEEEGPVTGAHCISCRYYPGEGSRCDYRTYGPAYVHYNTNACSNGSCSW